MPRLGMTDLGMTYRTHRRTHRRLALQLLSLLAVVATASVSIAHEGTRPRLDPSRVDSGGLFIDVRHPRVLRSNSPFSVSVTVENMLGTRDARVTGVRYGLPKPLPARGRDADQLLPSKRVAYLEHLAIDQELESAAKLRRVEEVDRLLVARARVLADLKRGAFVDRQQFSAADAVQDQFELEIDVSVEQAGVSRVIRRAVRIPVQPALPRGGAAEVQQRYDVSVGVFSDQPSSVDRINLDDDPWFSGDQHLHTASSLDAFLLDGTLENVGDYAATADALGLDWITVTDHSNINFTLGPFTWYTPQQFELGAAQAAAYTANPANDFLALNGEEMGTGQSPVLGMPSHLLVYPSSVDSTGFLANPCSGYIVDVAFCEDHQVIIDRANEAGGMGFIAHPTGEGTLYAPWDFSQNATGWAGMEIWNSGGGTFGDTDASAYGLWQQLLADVRRPRDGTLFDRPGFPSRFPVALGNSDAHTPGSIGATFTYAQMPEATRGNVSDALLSGRAVASNGPLLFAHVNGAGLGEVASGIDATTTVDVSLQTTPEFGPVGNYWVIVYVDGALRGYVPPSGSQAFSSAISIEGLDLQLPDKFVTLQASSIDGVHHAFTNPVWLSFPTCEGDVNDDLLVDLVDVVLVLLSQGPCDECPADVTRDGVVDVFDLVWVVQHMGSCLP